MWAVKPSRRVERSTPPRGPQDDRGEAFIPTGLTRRQIIARLTGTSKQDVDPITKSERKLALWLDVACVIAGGSAGALLWDRLIQPAHPVLSRFAVNEIGTLLCSATGAIGFWLLAMPGFRRRKWRQITELYLASGQCPACGYAITGQHPERDGCLVCPECGASWRAERVGESGLP